MIGEDIPRVIRRHVSLEYSPEQQMRYNKATEHARSNLMIVLPNGQLAWNAKSFRNMTPL